jgi:putative ABC transport system ATP-binding protein
MTTTTATTTTRPAARVVDAVKVYGGGDTAVRASTA